MKWFGGSIPEAISAAKSNNAIFLVYVHDSSDASKTTDEVLAENEVSTVLSSNKFVAIQLENGTEGATQFSQIYPLVLVPSLFFISGQTGIPLEVLGGPLSKEKLMEKLQKLCPNSTPAEDNDESKSSSSHDDMEQASNSSQPEPLPEESKEPEAKSVNAEVVLNSAEHLPEVRPPADDNVTGGLEEDQEFELSANGSSLSLDERVERAKVLVAEKQAQKAQEAQETERQKEIERRKMGQEVAKKKQQQQDDERKAALQDRRKEKEEDRLARERVKAQIAADRAEREARAALLRGESPASQDVAAPVPSAASSSSSPSCSTNNDISRLKFRLPDGSSSIAQFPASTTLEEVRQYIHQNVNVPFSNFNLTSTVHHRPFTAEDLNTNLRDLGLVPSAIIIILSASSSGGGRIVPSNGGMMNFLWILLSPITFLFGLVRQLFGGGNGSPRDPRSDDSDEPAPKRSREDGSATTRHRPTTAYGTRGEARLRREGNIHRLQNNDDDDENNTWNGNSTQQM